MGWSGTRVYYAEKNGKFFCFDTIKQRNDAVKNHGMEAVPSGDIYKYRIKYTKIPIEKYADFVANVVDKI